MRTITATEASRRFSDLLDAVEGGEGVTITRGGHAVAEIHPARRRTGRDLRSALESGVPGFDIDLDGDVADALRLVRDDSVDPWRDA
ncbi:type II toxin-antitoxin system Phd/YefM family antitoxin [Microbacterium luticocti]|uniref:type II toxin-antitoxin system Phd/YefM family antitoxin n=1 Tax=Microbacterium luticocti TaxID=451764 RepID=UPI00041309E5|nr:type II toxin-antitoxin system prevent-host-death family antitoxin [Microbacterium luticocti]